MHYEFSNQPCHDTADYKCPAPAHPSGGLGTNRSRSPGFSPINFRLQSPIPFTVYDNGLYISPFGMRISTNPSLTLQNGSPVTLGPNGVIFSGQYGNLSTRLTVNSERITGFGIAAVDRVAGNIAESSGVIVAPDQLSVTFTQSITVNNINVTIPAQIDMRYNPPSLIGILAADVVTGFVIAPKIFGPLFEGGSLIPQAVR